MERNNLKLGENLICFFFVVFGVVFVFFRGINGVIVVEFSDLVDLLWEGRVLRGFGGMGCVGVCLGV